MANEDVDRHQLYGRGYYNKVLKDMPEADARADARAVLDDAVERAREKGRKQEAEEEEEGGGKREEGRGGCTV